MGTCIVGSVIRATNQLSTRLDGNVGMPTVSIDEVNVAHIYHRFTQTNAVDDR